MTQNGKQTAVAAKSVIDRYLAAKEDHHLESLAALFAQDVIYIFPLPASGAQEDWFVYDGKEATMSYQRRI